jgi:uncharacterized lipoprotein YajG
MITNQATMIVIIMNKIMKKIASFLFLLSAILLLAGCSNDPTVKKSTAGICHQKGTNFYNNTKNFTPYNSIQECLDSGGRLPKK